GWYYALVPPRTAEGWDGDAPCFGPAHSITVPPPPCSTPPGPYWLLPAPDHERMLCDPYALWQLTTREDAPQ
ncbi:hypothetical protein ABZ951_33370, partial [Streptomyces sp. NPDC046215]